MLTSYWPERSKLQKRVEEKAKNVQRKERTEMVPDAFCHVVLFLVPKSLSRLSVAGDN